MRQTDRQTDRQANRQTNRQTDRQTDRQTAAQSNSAYRVGFVTVYKWHCNCRLRVTRMYSKENELTEGSVILHGCDMDGTHTIFLLIDAALE